MGVYKSEVSSRTQVDSGCRRKSTFFGVAWRSPGQSGEITHLFTGFLRVKDYVLRRTFRTWVGCQLVRPVRVEIPRRVRQLATAIASVTPKPELVVVIFGRPLCHEFPEPWLRAKVESMEVILRAQGFARVVFQLATATGRSIHPSLHHD